LTNDIHKPNQKQIFEHKIKPKNLPNPTFYIFIKKIQKDLYFYSKKILFNITLFFVFISMTETVSTTKLFVGGLAWKLRGRELREIFSPFGEIVFASVKLDRETGRSRGFGFVEFENPEDAATAQSEMDGTEVEGREIKVDFAKENPERMAARQAATENEDASEEAGEEAGEE